jgi:class 3 adenylate cyclase/tetratricopeptide (TPR) repeat protein
MREQAGPIPDRQSTANLYAPFVPARLVSHHLSDSQPPNDARAETCRGVVLFMDVIGYTRLTESYSQRGAEGVEQLMVLLNDFFARLESVISRHGGDILSFAGDSVLALWSDPSRDRLAGAARLAVQCACAAQRELDSGALPEDMRLRMCVGLGAGELFLGTVGGIGGEWKYVAAGAPIASAAHALKLGRAGAVVVDHEVGRLVQPYCTSAPIAEQCVEITAVTHLAPQPPTAPAAPADDTALRSYIPKPVLEHLDAGQRDWLAEFRQATTAFVAVYGMERDGHPDLSRLQRAVALVQQTVERYGGTVARISVDDKGTNLLCVWGIPGRRHEDDAARAASAALTFGASLRSAGIACGTGIATGRVLCGLVGGGWRCEYTVTGDTVNLAARLMVAAGDGILCDIATSISARSAVTFDTLPPIAVKGKDALVPVARPMSVNDVAADASRRPLLAELVGRDAERAQLISRIDGLQQRESAFVAIEGEPGVGKSRLVSELVAAATGAGVHALIGYADAIEDQTTYFVYRAILDAVLARRCPRGNAARRSYLEAHFAPTPTMQSWLPLLNDVLPLGFAHNDVSRGMTEQARAESTAELIVDMLRDEAARTPTLLVLEDAHWMDSMSWHVTARLREDATPLLLVLAMRSGYTPAADGAKTLLASPAMEHMPLETLVRGDVEALICERLRVVSVASEVVALVYEKTAGNPLFSEELCYAMRDGGYLVLDNGRCALAPAGEADGADDLPDTIQTVIASRIDRLSPSQQLTLKVASVSGRWFTPQLLGAIHPRRLDGREIASQLETLSALDLIRLDTEGPEPRYRFKHAMTQGVAYDLLLPTQQRQFHCAAGEWYEAHHTADLSAVYPLLAHHWKKADEPSKASHYQYKSGEQAVQRYALAEAIAFLDAALVFASRREPAETSELRAACERLLGYAWLWLGDMANSRRHIVQSFKILRRPIPSELYLVAHLVAQLAVHVCIRLVGRWLPRQRRDARPAELDEATALLRLGHIAYYMGDNPLAFYTSLRSLNFAEHRRDCAETALIYAAMVVGAGMAGMQGLARRYVKLALGAVRLVREPSISSQVLMFISIYDAGVCQWRSSMARVKRAAELSALVGASRRIDECMVVRAFVHFHKGELGPALQFFEATAAGGRARGDRQAEGWGVLGISRVRLAQNRIDDALSALSALHETQPLAADQLSKVELYGQLALAHLRRKDLTHAIAAARTGLPLITGARQTSFSTLTGTAGIAECLIVLWAYARRGDVDEDPLVLGREVRAALRALRRLARLFPVGRPQALLQSAAYARVLGRERRALKLLRRSRDIATRYGMEYEEARIALALARRLAGAESDAERARASAICARLGISEDPSLAAIF